MRPVLAATLAFGLFTGPAITSVMIEACNPAEQAAVKNFETEFLANYQAGLTAIETAFDALDPALATVAGLVDVVIVDTITLLEDAGVFGDAGSPEVVASLKAAAQAKITPQATEAAIRLHLKRVR